MGVGSLQLLVVVGLLVLLFGRGRISSLMRDVASGISGFRRGLRDGVDDDACGSSDVSSLPGDGAAPRTAHRDVPTGSAEFDER